MFKNFDLKALRREQRVAYYFRYPLFHSDFHEVREAPRGRLVGRFAAKPLYGRLTAEGRVDKSRGFNGQIAILFVPARARSPHAAKLYLTRVTPARITLPDGKRDWKAIRAAAVQEIMRQAALE